MDVSIVVLGDVNLLKCLREGFVTKLVINGLGITDFERWSSNTAERANLSLGEASSLTRWVEAHQLRVAALHGAVDVRAVHLELIGTVLGGEQSIVFDVSLPVAAAKQVALAHTLWCEQTLTDGELV